MDALWKNRLLHLPIFHPFLPQLDAYPIAEGKPLKVNLSEPKRRLFVGNIPKTLRKEDILKKFQSLTGKVYNPACIDNKQTFSSFNFSFCP